ncbi:MULTISPECIES: chemotaxis protein CheW [Cupriavidus]|uniref:Chemotaxis protein CheW n=1 Tax=Cupriavidus pauculus TaxID=82633 RepID=A0A5P2HD33_9BURK|nr:chemotaxis protein CheW [Cupriavidus pauculus]QET04980.1 chemotaxis protein CheW [Cupriavidus pauculus]
MKLFLLFRIGSDHYALDTAEIAEVLPLTALKQIPGAPAWVAGLMVRHGKPVPVIDISALAVGTPVVPRTSSRTVLVHYRPAHAGDDRPAQLLGLRLEYATETLRCEEDSFVDGGIDPGTARYLGPVRHDARGLVQWITVPALLPDDVRALLYPESNAARDLAVSHP